MAARFEHQRAPHPVVIAKKNLALLDHRHVRQQRSDAGDDAHRVAAGVGIDAEEAVTRHERSPWRQFMRWRAVLSLPKMDSRPVPNPSRGEIREPNRATS